jgi:cell division transport system permease protein
MFTNTRRIAHGGIINFWRNGWISFATVLIMVITLFVIGSLFLGSVLLSSVLDSLEDKVDITVYFTQEAPEGDVVAVRDKLLTLEEVEHAGYISRENALMNFQERHKENTLIIQSLEELGENPLGASITIRATDPSHYEAINNFLEANIISSMLDKVNFRQNELVINRLSHILDVTRRTGVGASIVLGFVAFIVAFNTIRMAIYTSREEIRVMKLVGASDWYTRGPFLVEGFLHGLFASVITTLMFFPITLWIGPRAETFFGGPDLFSYYTTHIVQLFLVLFFVGITIGILSSLFAIRRYLRA